MARWGRFLTQKGFRIENNNRSKLTSVKPLLTQIIQLIIKSDQNLDTGNCLLIRLTWDSRSIKWGNLHIGFIPIHALFKSQNCLDYFPIAIWKGKEGEYSFVTELITGLIDIVRRKTPIEVNNQTIFLNIVANPDLKALFSIKEINVIEENIHKNVELYYHFVKIKKGIIITSSRENFDTFMPEMEPDFTSLEVHSQVEDSGSKNLYLISEDTMEWNSNFKNSLDFSLFLEIQNEQLMDDWKYDNYMKETFNYPTGSELCPMCHIVSSQLWYSILDPENVLWSRRITFDNLFGLYPNEIDCYCILHATQRITEGLLWRLVKQKREIADWIINFFKSLSKNKYEQIVNSNLSSGILYINVLCNLYIYRGI
jgi:hypothetical protein